jgi:hypothetical protein
MRALALAVVAVLSSGCAAVFGTKEKEFALHSEPAGAEVYVDGNRVGTTPAKVRLSNHREHTFVFRKEGYKETTCTMVRRTNAGWVILDILGGVVPVIIDAATGSWSQVKGSTCSGNLDPLVTSSR